MFRALFWILCGCIILNWEWNCGSQFTSHWPWRCFWMGERERERKNLYPPQSSLLNVFHSLSTIFFFFSLSQIFPSPLEHLQWEKKSLESLTTAPYDYKMLCFRHPADREWLKASPIFHCGNSTLYSNCGLTCEVTFHKKYNSHCT